MPLIKVILRKEGRLLSILMDIGKDVHWYNMITNRRIIWKYREEMIFLKRMKVREIYIYDAGI